MVGEDGDDGEMLVSDVGDQEEEEDRIEKVTAEQ